MLFALISCIYAKSPEIEDFPQAEEEKESIIVVGSYIGADLMLHHKQDINSNTKEKICCATQCIPTFVVGYGDMIGHLYLGLEGGLGYGFGEEKKQAVTEAARFHFNTVMHVGFLLTPISRLYCVLGLEKTEHKRSQEVLKDGQKIMQEIASANGFAPSFGTGVMVTIGPRVGVGMEMHYVPKKSWQSVEQSTEKIDVSAWQMDFRIILFI